MIAFIEEYSFGHRWFTKDCKDDAELVECLKELYLDELRGYKDELVNITSYDQIKNLILEKGIEGNITILEPPVHSSYECIPR